MFGIADIPAGEVRFCLRYFGKLDTVETFNDKTPDACAKVVFASGQSALNAFQGGTVEEDPEFGMQSRHKIGSQEIIVRFDTVAEEDEDTNDKVRTMG